jgi:hypothetical protein
MDIEIIIDGGEELREFYPKHYEKFEEKISELITGMFPGVGGWCISPKLTKRHQEQEREQEELRAQEFEQTFFRVIEKYPEVRELFQVKAEPGTGTTGES